MLFKNTYAKKIVEFFRIRVKGKKAGITFLALWMR